MKASALNRKVKRARARADHHVDPLAAAYQREIDRAADTAVEWFHENMTALTASTTWQPPQNPDSLLIVPSQQTIDRLRHEQEAFLRTMVDAMGIAGLTWDVVAPMTDRLLAATAARAEGVLGAGVREVVQRAIEESYAGGATIPETAAAIRAAVTTAAPWQATMLARTDMISLANGGSIAAVRAINNASDAGDGSTFQTKTWLATPDERTRETHVEADGQEVPIDQMFVVGDSELDYPGDPNGSDEEVINCRCTVLFSDGTERSAETAAAPIRLEAEMDDALTAATVTVTVDDDEPGEVEAATMPVAWEAILALEGIPTADGRFFQPGSVTWRALPLTLLTQFATEPGHDGAEVSGRIDQIWREDNGDGTARIMGSGVFDTGKHGVETARMVREQVLTGLSVDTIATGVALRDPETGAIIDPDEMDPFDLLMGTTQYQTVLLNPCIGAATVVAFPAFGEASIAVTASATHHVTITVPDAFTARDDALTASALGLAPVHPPASWFDNPHLDGPTPLTVTDDGRVYGHLATWGTCHLGFPDQCKEPPRSRSDYAFFHLGELETEEGDLISVGTLTLDTGHAGLSLGRGATVRHYDDTGTGAADVRAGEDDYGIWVAGAVRPDIPAGTLRRFRAARLSGDWRKINGSLELVAALCVNLPGFPIPRAQANVAAVQDDQPVLSLVAAGVLCPCADETMAVEVKCANCGKMNPADAEQCQSCGQTMAAQVECPNCGAMNDAGATECSSCGEPMPGGMTRDEAAIRVAAIATLSRIEP